ncbi:MAG: hypothetical protein RLZZ573_1902, partial [Pseudomonadota bacterium]
AGTDGVLAWFFVGRGVRGEFCADPVAALHPGHQTARLDRSGDGRQGEGHFRFPGAFRVCG